MTQFQLKSRSQRVRTLLVEIHLLYLKIKLQSKSLNIKKGKTVLESLLLQLE